MKVLAIESSTHCGSVAVADGGKTLASRRLAKNAEELTASVKEILAETSIPPSGIDLVAVSAGPGFFTSLKVGAAAAKAFAFALNIPIAPVPSLEILAASAPCPDGGTVCAAIDARSGLFFGAAFKKEGGTVKRLSEDALMTGEELAALTAELKKRANGETANGGNGGVFAAVLQESGGGRAKGGPPPGAVASPSTVASPSGDLTISDGFTVIRAEASVCAALGAVIFEHGKTETALSFSPRYMRDDLYTV